MLLYAKAFKFKESYSILKRLEAKAQYDGDFRYLVGEFHRIRKDEPKAIEEYSQAIVYDPNHISALYRLGEIALKRNEGGKALLYFLRIIDNDLTEDLAIVKKLVSYVQLDRDVRAKIEINRLLEQDSKNPIYNLGKGLILVEAGEIQTSLEWFKKAFELDPNNEEILTTLADTYFSLGRNEDATLMFKRISLSNPLNPEGNFRAGELLYKEGKLEEALEQFKSVAAIAALYPSIHYILYQIYWDLKKFEQATESLQRQIELSPKQTKYRTELIELYLYSDKTEEAETMLLQNLRTNPDDLTSNILMSRVFVAKGKSETAETYLRIAKDIDIKNPVISREYGFLYKSTNNNAEAKKNFQAYLDASPGARDTELVQEAMKGL